MAKDPKTESPQEPERNIMTLEAALGESRHRVRLADGREFAITPMTIREYSRFKQLDDNDWEAQAAFLAPLLEKRALDGQPVSVDYVLDNVPAIKLNTLGMVLVRGEVPDPKPEVE